MKNVFILTVLLFLVLVNAGCTNNNKNIDKNTSVSLQLPAKKKNTTGVSENIQSLTGNGILNDTGRYTNPDDIVIYEIRLYCIECNFDQSVTAQPGENVFFNWLFEGSYTLEVIAKDIYGIEIFGGSNENIEVLPLKNTKAKVVLTCLTRCRVNQGCDPAKPSNFSILENSDNEIELSWEDNSSDEDGFIILRKYTDESKFEEIARLETNETSYLDDTVVYNEGDTVWYMIKSFKKVTEKNLCTSFPVSTHLPDDSEYLYNIANWNESFWQ